MMKKSDSTQNKTSGLLDKKFPAISRLNNKAVILLTGMVVLIILIMLISAFSSSTPEKRASSLPQISNNPSSMPVALKQLPDSYQDAGQIQQILGRHSQGENKLSASVQAELDQLRAEQSALKAQLVQLHQQKISPQQPFNSPLTREAQTSAIFFAGGAPNIANQNNQTPAKQSSTKTTKEGQGETSKSNAFEQQNMQAQKLSFLNSKPDKKIYNPNSLQYPVSKYILQAGSVIPAILETQINSNLPGNIVAIVSTNVYDSITGQYLLLPKGTKLLGEYNSQLSYGQDQIQVKFNRLIRPDGTSIVLPNPQGVNDLGVSGLADEVNNHWGQIVGSAVLSAAFNIPSIVATNQMYASQNCNSTTGVCTPSFGSLAKASALQSVGQSTSQIGSQIATRSLNLQPTVIVHAGFNFSVLVTKDMVLAPYHDMLSSQPSN